MKSANTLIFDGNKIEKLPECISQLEELKVLSFKYNPIETFPSSMAKLLKLRYIYLSTESSKILLPKEMKKMTRITFSSLKKSYDVSILKVKQ